MTETQIALSLQGLRKSYGGAVAVDGVDLELRRGEFFSLLGPSGCGKTTTLRMIAGFEKPDGGTILLDGRDVSRLPPYERDVNTVFQDYALFPHLSVSQNVEYGLRVKGVARGERRKRVEDMLELVRLSGFGERRPAQLSGGQRQRVALARALVNYPALLLLDEPLGALDLKLRQAMQVELRRIQRQMGITFCYVTHDQEEALSMSDRLAVMDGGKILQLGSPHEVYEHPRSAFVAGFVGTSNRLLGRVSAPEQVELADGSVRAPGLSAAVGEEVQLIVRPERLSIQRQQQPPELVNALPALLRDVSFLGIYSRYELDLPSGATLVMVDQNRGAGVVEEAGARVWVTWAPENTLVLGG